MSSSKARHRRSSRILLVLVMVLGLAFSALPVLGQDAGFEVPDDVVSAINAQKAEATYIVQMIDDPVVAYDGGIRGLAATEPKNGKKIDPNSGKVVKYVEYLNGKHNGALNGVGAGLDKKLYDYAYTFNGFAASLTGSEAAAMQARDDVVMVYQDELMQLDTSTTPDFLGLTAEGGAWGMGYVGEDVIIGIVDSGIWPEHPSFSDRTGENPKGKPGKLDYQQIPGWHGKCVPGDYFPASDCNQKLIGAQYYGAGWGGEAGTLAAFPYEFWSARDADGHGTHTASTAGGNGGVSASVNDLDFGETNGIAPRARIAAYKVCWGISPEGGCFGSDSVAAIDQAVADGVDVINFSISGTSTNFADPVEVAFLFAADAGVFVAASAGNTPGPSTVAHPSPWITTVAAGTHDRFYEGFVDLGDGSSYSGATSNTTGTEVLDLVYAADAAADGVLPADAAICLADTLDGALVEGKMVLCDRGAIARVAKSAEVARVGGVAMIHANVSSGTINADIHSVPTLHVDHIDGAFIRAYAQTDGATAQLSARTLTVAEAPFQAGFSSSGPLLGSADLLKPDIMAPGVDVLAGVSPYSAGGNLFDFYSGTSMSGPHVAGLAAVVKSAHPDWSPAMIKSALMTTSSQMTNEDNPIPGTPFDYGSGHVVPNSAIDPGLVYDADLFDYAAFTCAVDAGVFTPGSCVFLSNIGYPTEEPSDLNQPNVTIGELAGSQTVTRRVTNVADGQHTYKATVDEPAGVEVVVSPDTLTLDPGETAFFTLTFTTTESALIGEYAFGNLTWTHGPHAVNSVLTVRPVQAAFPGSVDGAGESGTLSFDIDFGYAGEYTAAAHGLVPASMEDGNVVDDPANDINAALGTCDFSSFPYQCTGITWHLVEVPVGSAYAQFSLFDDYTDGNDDLDLYVWSPSGFFGGSGSGTSAEQVSGVFPEPGFYEVAVHGWQTDGPDSNYTLFSWAFGPDAGNMTVTAPAAAVLGTTETITVDWAGLTAGEMYLGAVSHSDSGGIFGLTLVEIDG
ncbi:MAG: S8 family peptidase [Acidimicrobiia bacterium]|nr:S8 family peptidase [Acidimicrobiia bacterium]